MREREESMYYRASAYVHAFSLIENFRLLHERALEEERGRATVRSSSPWAASEVSSRVCVAIALSVWPPSLVCHTISYYRFIKFA